MGKWVGAKTIELHAMGRLQDGAIRKYLDYSGSSVVLMFKFPSWMETLEPVFGRSKEISAHRPQANKEDLGRQVGA